MHQSNLKAKKGGYRHNYVMSVMVMKVIDS